MVTYDATKINVPANPFVGGSTISTDASFMGYNPFQQNPLEASMESEIQTANGWIQASIRNNNLPILDRLQVSQEGQYLGSIMNARDHLNNGEELSLSNFVKLGESVEYFERTHGEDAVKNIVGIAHKVMGQHFAMKLGIDPSSDYEDIGRATLRLRYFEGVNRKDPEFNTVMNFLERVCISSEDYNVTVGNYDSLINPNWLKENGIDN